MTYAYSSHKNVYITPTGDRSWHQNLVTNYGKCLAEHVASEGKLIPSCNSYTWFEFFFFFKYIRDGLNLKIKNKMWPKVTAKVISISVCPNSA